MCKKLTKLLCIQTAILLVGVNVAFADGMPLEPIGADSTYNVPSIKNVSSNNSTAAKTGSVQQTDNFQSALFKLDSAQVEMRNNLVDLKTKYQDVDARYQLVKQERKLLHNEVKTLEKRIKNIDKTKENIRKNMGE
ncbi:MAG: hypothetical protein MRZ90_07470 [Candidatus Gastranaerophilales bacterium]|nr:hypothetical protein [Candidatus Gastranaerophilales bacterium]